VLKEHSHDGRCIKLMQELLDAGYREDWTYNQTLSGVPQGGIVSPILSNILLDKLDKFVENVLIPQYTGGSRRKINPEYDKLRKDSRNQRRKGNTEKAEELRKQSQTLPSVMTNDPDYRRLKYVRFADDFVLGFVGPRSEAEEIKQQLSRFVREELKLERITKKRRLSHMR
jgi:retron-type reverse transcriptase